MIDDTVGEIGDGDSVKVEHKPTKREFLVTLDEELSNFSSFTGC